MKINIINPFLFILIAIASCNSNETTQDISESNELSYDSLIKYSVVNLDTILNDTCFIRIESFNTLDSNSLIIYNGNWDTIYDLLKAQNNYSINPFDNYDLAWSTVDFIALRVGCGTTCFDDIVIPLFSGGKPQRYFLAYAPDMKSIRLESNILVYLSENDTSNGFPFFIVKNLITGEMDSIKPDDNFEEGINPYSSIDTVFASSTRIMLGQFDENGKLIHNVEKKIDLGITERPIETWYYGNRIESAGDLLLFRNNKFVKYYSDNHGDVYETFGRYEKSNDLLILNDTIDFHQNLSYNKLLKLIKSDLSSDTLYSRVQNGIPYYSTDSILNKHIEFNWRLTRNFPKYEVIP